jgi:CheY-like chemotaxis protein
MSFCTIELLTKAAEVSIEQTLMLSTFEQTGQHRNSTLVPCGLGALDRVATVCTAPSGITRSSTQVAMQSHSEAADVILVVDDNAGVRALVRAVLEKAGYTIYTAADGSEGLACFECYKTRIGLLLTDVTMPRMNGLQLADRVRECRSSLPVLFMSGDAHDLPNDDYGLLRKPFKSDELIGRVADALARRPIYASQAE